VALQLVVDLFVNFYNTVNPLLRKVLMLLVSFIKRLHQSLAGIGIAAFVRLMSNAGELFSDDKWLEVVLSIKEAANETLPKFSFLESEDFVARNEEHASTVNDRDRVESGSPDELESLSARRLYVCFTNAKGRAAVQILLIQVKFECTPPEI
jgi:brefeldin A-inhibited guanine nucleotide-exchange protein